jgi:hypothetical protein
MEEDDPILYRSMVNWIMEDGSAELCSDVVSPDPFIQMLLADDDEEEQEEDESDDDFDFLFFLLREESAAAPPGLGRMRMQQFTRRKVCFSYVPSRTNQTEAVRRDGVD